MTEEGSRRVRASLQQAGNKTPLEVAVRGLLVPGEVRQVQHMAETLARQEVAKFVSRIETLKLVMRRGGKSRVEWGRLGLEVSQDNMEEFEAARKVAMGQGTHQDSEAVGWH